MRKLINIIQPMAQTSVICHDKLNFECRKTQEAMQQNYYLKNAVSPLALLTWNH